MSFVALGVAVVGGGMKIWGAAKGAEARKAEQLAANKELAERKAAYEDMDTSNPYADLENVFEDLTVNTQQAEMMNQQNQQNQANLMQGMNQAAGGSGVAGMAQAMANQSQLQTQQASASIGQQESANQKAAMAEESRLQSQEARGERETQKLEKDKIETLFGMSQQRKISADAARQRATDAMASGIGDIAGGVLGGVMTGVGNTRAKKAGEGNKGWWDSSWRNKDN